MEYGGLVDDHQEDCGGAAFGTMGEGDHVIEELLVEGCWVEASDNNLMAMQPPQYMGEGEHFNDHHHHHHQIECAAAEDQEESGFVVGKRWWIGPRANPGPSSSVKERLVVAVGYLKEYTKNSTNVLIQIWVPALRRRRSGLIHNNHYHTANHHESVSVGFPNPNVNVQVKFFRSHEYPRVQAQQQQQQCQYGSLALPVFERGSGTCLGVLEIVMTNQTLINYRLQLDDNLSNALEAVDFRSSQTMILPPAVKVFDELYQAAVNEIVEVLASVCKTHNLPLALTWAPCIQQGKGGCGVSSTEIISCVSTVDSACFVGDVDVLGFQEACYEYHLFHGQGIVGTAFTTTKPCFAIDITAFSKAEYPLAHHAKVFGLHAAVAIPLRSVYTGSAADFVLEFFLPKECRDSEEQKQMLNSLSLVVQQACRSLHLHVVMMEDEYTLPTNNTNTMPLPPAAATAPAPEPAAAPPSRSQSQVDLQACSKESSSCSWIAHMMEAQHKGKGVSVSLEYLQEPKEEFKVTTNWERDQGGTLFSDFGGQVVMEQSSNSRASAVSVEGGTEESAGGGGCGRRSSSSGGGRKSGDKRRTKAEKTISLPVLRQYFAGSLKDAAKSIGVCPTTLKRICRQHGITRWPSRKIKKVGHSLKKLQLVIDSVQGAEGAIQIGSFYASFPELSSATTCDQSSSMIKMHSINSNPPPDQNSSSCFYGHDRHGVIMTTSLKSPPSACSFATTTVGNQTSSTLINNNNTVSVVSNHGDVLMTESQQLAPPDHNHNHTALLRRRAHSEEADQLHHAASISMMMQDADTKQYYFNGSKSQQTQLPPSGGWNSSSSSSLPLERGAFRVKATFADEKIRFSLQPIWCYRDLELEIARRFNVNDMSNLVVKYLDDEGEWVVLGCDADLEECKDLHTSSHSRTIRLSLFQASPLNTFRNTSPS